MKDNFYLFELMKIFFENNLFIRVIQLVRSYVCCPVGLVEVHVSLDIHGYKIKKKKLVYL